MTERATIHQLVQIGVESVAGTRPAGGANRRLQSISISPGIQMDLNLFRAKGYKFPSVGAQGREWVQAAIEGQADYNELTWLLASILATPTPAQQGATAAYQCDFTPDSDGPDTVSSFYVEEGGSVRAHAFAYGLMTEFGYEITRQAFNISGQMIGQALSENISSMGVNEVQTLSITGTPTGGTFTITFGGETTAAIDYDATAAEVQAALVALSSIGAGNMLCSGGPLPGTAVVCEFQGDEGQTNQAIMTTTDSLTGGTDPETAVAETVAGGAATSYTLNPILPEHVSIYMDSAYGSLGTTLLTRVLKASFKLNNRQSPLWPINAAEDSYAAVVETEPEATLELLVEADSVGMGLLTTARAGTKKFIRLEAEGDEIASPYNYKFTHDMCGIISAVGEFSDEEGVFAIPWTFKLAHDPTWGKAMDVDLINIITAL